MKIGTEFKKDATIFKQFSDLKKTIRFEPINCL